MFEYKMKNEFGSFPAYILTCSVRSPLGQSLRNPLCHCRISFSVTANERKDFSMYKKLITNSDVKERKKISSTETYTTMSRAEIELYDFYSLHCQFHLPIKKGNWKRENISLACEWFGSEARMCFFEKSKRFFWV